MEIIVTQKYLRISPKKVGQVTRLIKKTSPAKAVQILPFLGKKAAGPLEKLIKSGLAIARQKGIADENLYIKEIRGLEGARLKRGTPVSRGRWHPILKRMSHLRLVLSVKEEDVARIKKTGKVAKEENNVEKKEKIVETVKMKQNKDSKKKLK